MTNKPKRDVSALNGRWDDLLLVWKLMLDREVNVSLKLLPIVALIYLVMPVDLVPDIALGLGQVDDIGVLLLALTTFLRLVPPERVAHARGDLSESADEGSWVEGQAHHKKEDEEL